MQNKRIPMPAKDHNFITWLDGCDASYWSEKYIPETDEREFEFKPHEKMRWQHQIQDWEYNLETGRIIARFPEEYCVDRSTSARTIRWFITCDYRSKKPLPLDYIHRENLIKIESLKNENQALKMALLKAQKSNYKKNAFQEEEDKKTFDRLKKMRKIIDVTQPVEEEEK